MNAEAWIVVSVLVTIFLAMAWRLVPADIMMVGALVLLWTTGNW